MGPLQLRLRQRDLVLVRRALESGHDPAGLDAVAFLRTHGLDPAGNPERQLDRAHVDVAVELERTVVGAGGAYRQIPPRRAGDGEQQGDRDDSLHPPSSGRGRRPLESGAFG